VTTYPHQLRKKIHIFSKYVILQVVERNLSQNMEEQKMGRKMQNIVKGIASLATVFPTTAYSDFHRKKESDWQVIGKDFIRVGKDIQQAEKEFDRRYLREKEA